MMMVSKIIAGKYAGCKMLYSKVYGHIKIESTGVYVDNKTVESVEFGGSEDDFRTGQAVVGAALLGPIGLLVGGNNKRYSVILNWRDGERSLCDLNKQEYEAIQMRFF
ncbi:MAG: hypothetical protein FWG72_02290 [Oscillospiraceae bacterium]|nr:hypothetical protein [Oscillospiraceae bacterium]